MVRVKKALMLALMVMTTMLMAVPVFADTLTADQISKIQSYLGTKAGTDGSLPSELQAYVSESSGENTTPVTYTYKDSSGQTVEKTIYVNNATANNFITSASNDSSIVQGNVNSIIGEVGLTANTSQATVMMSGITPIISLFVGIIAWVIVIFLPIMSGLDILYLTVPLFREKADEIKSSNQGANNAMVKTRNGETKVRWISDEAQYAVKFASYEDGKSPLSIYLKKRAWAYILIAIVLFMFLTGNIQILTQIAVKAVSGVMQVLGGLAQ